MWWSEGNFVSMKPRCSLGVPGTEFVRHDVPCTGVLLMFLYPTMSHQPIGTGEGQLTDKSSCSSPAAGTRIEQVAGVVVRMFTLGDSQEGRNSIELCSQHSR